MNRRTFLNRSSKLAIGLGASPLIPRLISAPAFAQTAGNQYRAIVCLFLYGGNDGNNTIVPVDQAYSDYIAGRDGLALDRKTLNLLKPTSDGRLFGLHPNLVKVASLFNQGSATWLVNTGPLAMPYKKGQDLSTTPQNLFSHAGQSTEWQSAVTRSDSTSGWAGRIADVLSKRQSHTSPVVVSTGGWQLLGSGLSSDMAAIAPGNNVQRVVTALQSLAPSLAQMEAPSSNQLIDEISRMQSSYLATTSLLLGAVSAGSTMKTKFPNSRLGQQLQVIAQIINGRANLDINRQVFISSADGYDTHTQQLAVQAANLAEMDEAVSAFATAMQEIDMFDQVTLFTMSDFARSHQANSSGGTDHAWGNHHLIVGGSVKGGDLYGNFPDLKLGGDDDFGTTGLWIPTTSGTQYAATLAKWLGVTDSDTGMIFPELNNFPAGTLNFLSQIN
jgi:uncharacterized protein (DUF1501 family)